MKIWQGARRRWYAGGAVVAVAAAAIGVTVAMWPRHGSERELPSPRARVYTDRQACLLTGERGLADPAAASVWAGMQDASARTAAKVTYLAMGGQQSAAAAGPYLATLATRHCTVVLTVGAVPGGGVAVTAPRFPGTSFVVVAGPHETRLPANATSVAAVRADVAAAVEKAVG